MPFVKKAEFDKLMICGTQLSNVCWNLKDRSQLEPQHRQTMTECVAAWDKAAMESRETEQVRKSKRRRRG